jgi:hypothetical protein
MRVPALFAVIALGTFNPAVPWAAASSTSHRTNSALATVHPNTNSNVQRRAGANKVSSAQSPSTHVAPRSAAPVLGGRTQYDAKKGAVIGGPAIGRKR